MPHETDKFSDLLKLDLAGLVVLQFRPDHKQVRMMSLAGKVGSRVGRINPHSTAANQRWLIITFAQKPCRGHAGHSCLANALWAGEQPSMCRPATVDRAGQGRCERFVPDRWRGRIKQRWRCVFHQVCPAPLS